MAADSQASGHVSFRARGPSYIATIAVGHGLKHWYLAAFAVFLPLIEEEYALTTTGVAVLVTIRQVASGAPNFFVGYITDRLHQHWNLLLPASFLASAGAFALAGLSQWYWPMVAFFSLGGLTASLWHPPAISMLSARFPDRKGLTIAFHGSGSGAGEALGPLGVGFVLAVFMADDWRLYTILSMIPAVGITALIYWMLVGAGAQPRPERSEPVKITDTFTLLRFPAYQTLAFVNFSRSFTHFGLLAFLPLYLARDLDMNSFGVGLHVGLLTLVGAAVGPAYGHMSDRVGRRMPIILALVVIAIGSLAMGIVASGIPFTFAIALTGLFLWSVQDVTNAAAMDVAPLGMQGSVVGLMFSSSLVSAALAPALMGLVINLTDTRRAIFFLGAAAVVPAVVMLFFAPLERREEAA